MLDEADDHAVDQLRGRFQDAFEAAWRGDAEVDGLNGLVLRAGLTWRQAAVLRAYSRYLRQAGSAFSQDYIQNTLLNAHPGRRRSCCGCSRPASTRSWATPTARPRPRRWPAS